MKNLVRTTLIVLSTIQLLAQGISPTYHGHGTGSPNRFYVDLVGKAATLNGDWGLFGGMRAGYNINENFSIGLAGYGLIPDKLGGSYINQDGQDELHFGYGGAEAFYNYNLSDKFYLSCMMLVGAGRVDYENLGGHDYFFMMEPGVSVNYRLTNWFGLGYSVSYRFASGVNYADFSNASFSGWTTELDFNFGF